MIVTRPYTKTCLNTHGRRPVTKKTRDQIRDWTCKRHMNAHGQSQTQKKTKDQTQDWILRITSIMTTFLHTKMNLYTKRWEVKGDLFSNHSAVKREQIIFTLETMKRRQESGIGISFIDS